MYQIRFRLYIVHVLGVYFVVADFGIASGEQDETAGKLSLLSFTVVFNPDNVIVNCFSFLATYFFYPV